MIDITHDTVVRRKVEVLSSWLPSGAVLLDIDAARYIDLNVTAAAVWELLEAPLTFRALCAALDARFNVSAEQCQLETRAVLQQLLAWNVVAVDH